MKLFVQLRALAEVRLPKAGIAIVIEQPTCRNRAVFGGEGGDFRLFNGRLAASGFAFRGLRGGIGDGNRPWRLGRLSRRVRGRKPGRERRHLIRWGQAYR